MSTATDTTTSQVGTSNGRRAIITIGEVKGIIENQKESELSGFCMVPIATNKPNIIGSITGNINCWVSESVSTADPIAANTEA